MPSAMGCTSSADGIDVIRDGMHLVGDGIDLVVNGLTWRDGGLASPPFAPSALSPAEAGLSIWVKLPQSRDVGQRREIGSSNLFRGSKLCSRGSDAVCTRGAPVCAEPCHER